MNIISSKTILLKLLVGLLLTACSQWQISKDIRQSPVKVDIVISGEKDSILPVRKANVKPAFVVSQDIPVKRYFAFMDSLVSVYDSLLDYPLTEHILVHANPWIIDTLVSFDYYKKISQGMFIYDQREMIVLKKGDTLWLPDQPTADSITARMQHTLLDVNIPEYKLRIIAYDTVQYTFRVRVGRNERKYLKTARRVVSLQTPIGKGEIIRIERNPWFVNPVTGISYSLTKRDDGKYTKMPQIPWLEPMINGQRQGALIHPTSNANTLGKAYSNGCVGTGEGDAWIIYYHAPVGTKVHFRYDLEVTNEQGDTVWLKDIYQLNKARTQSISSAVTPNHNHHYTSTFYSNSHLYQCY